MARKVELGAVLLLLAVSCGKKLEATPCADPLGFGAGPLEPVERRAPDTAGRTFHVDAGGSDASDCSEAAPCREIARAAPLLRAGDTLVIGEGEYARFGLSGARGREGAPIALFAPRGALVRGDPGCDRRDRTCASAILIERSAHVLIDGLGATGAPRAGLSVELGHHITVRNGVFDQNGTWGIFASFVDDLVIEHNRTSASRTQHGIYASNSGDRTVVRANLVRGNHAGGIQINADWNVKDAGEDYPGQVDGISTGAVIERNVIVDNGAGGGGAINLDGVQDSVVRDNLLLANRASGIVLFGDRDGREDGEESEDGDGRQGPSGMLVAHNTVVQPSGSRAALLIRFSAGPNVVRSNILLHHDERRAGILLGGEEDAKLLDSDHNVLDRVLLDGNKDPGARMVDLGRWQGEGHDRHSFSAEEGELFAVAGCDLRLARGSPARDRGATAPEAGPDLLGRSRGRAPDIGALEAP